MRDLFPVSVEDAVRRTRTHGERLCCHVTTRLDEALAEAEGRTGALAGVPYGLKDEFDTPHLPTTGGSWRFAKRHTPGVHSTPFRAFDEAGAVLIGKSNLSDLGLAPEASSYVGGSTKNPFDSTRTSGGSSGGSAAAVAYGMHAFDWGTDIGGSIRLPAAFCGVLGLKLSDEAWPIRELFPTVPESMRWLCGQGPFTRTTKQMRAVLKAAQAHMRLESAANDWSPRRVELYAPEPGRWPSFAADVVPVLQRALDLPVRTCAALPSPAKAREYYAGVWASHLDALIDEADAGLGLADGIAAVLSALLFRGRFGDRRIHPSTAELLLLIAIGHYTVFRNTDKAIANAMSIRNAYRDLWADGAIVVTPVCAHPPPRIYRSNWNPELLAYTVHGNLSDATGLSIPFGTFDGRLPRSIQLLGPPGSEQVLLDLADAIIAERDKCSVLRQPETFLD
ncbi:MAG: amidase [Polyangiaceae bacterium]